MIVELDPVPAHVLVHEGTGWFTLPPAEPIDPDAPTTMTIGYGWNGHGFDREERQTIGAPLVVPGTRVLFYAKDEEPASGDNGGIFYNQSSNTLRIIDANGSLSWLPLSLGAIVGSGVVAEVLPIVDPEQYENLASAYEGPAAIMATDRYVGHVPEWGGALDEDEIADLSSLLPFATWEPGRTAYRVEDAAPTTARCPTCWGDPAHGPYEARCPTCGDAGVCGPFQMPDKAVQ